MPATEYGLPRAEKVRRMYQNVGFPLEETPYPTSVNVETRTSPIHGLQEGVLYVAGTFHSAFSPTCRIPRWAQGRSKWEPLIPPPLLVGEVM